MEIRQLKYFIEIVRCNCNLTAASEKLSLSQPALSTLVNKFERRENTELFLRHRGHLVGLTSVGEHFYNNALGVVEAHDKMLQELRRNAAFVNGRMRLGIPPLILTVLCTQFLDMLLHKYVDATYEIVEKGAFELERQLLLGELDAALLLRPINLNGDAYDDLLLEKDELSAFMSTGHPLAGREKITWRDLSGQDLVIFDDSYMIHHKVIKRLDALRIDCRVALQSKSWDFLLESVRRTNYITILPSPISSFYNLHDVQEVHIEDPLAWEVTYVYPRRGNYSRIERATLEEFQAYFTPNHAR